MIEFQHVTKRYGKNSEPSVKDLCLTVDAGCVFGFLGPNGAGKTTTIRMLTGILQPTEGDVLVDGYSMKHEPLAAKRLIGFVPDEHETYDRLTGMEYLNFIADMYLVSKADRGERIAKYLDMFELKKAAGDQVRSYSRGMKQKLTVIGALLHDPAVWVLDEPMVGLDPRASHLLKEEMRRRADAGATIFFSTHVLEVAEKLCDKVGIIDHGKMIACGTLEELRGTKGDESLEKLFLELTDAEEDKA